MKHYLEETNAVFAEVGTSAEGLSSAEAAARLEKNGKEEVIYRIARLYDESKNNTNYYWTTSEERKNYIDANFGRDLNTVVTYSWLGKDYKIDYGDCALTITPTQKYFPKDGRNYLMPIPKAEITKSKGSIVQNPHYDDPIPTDPVILH